MTVRAGTRLSHRIVHICSRQFMAFLYHVYPPICACRLRASLRCNSPSFSRIVVGKSLFFSQK